MGAASGAEAGAGPLNVKLCLLNKVRRPRLLRDVAPQTTNTAATATGRLVIELELTGCELLMEGVM
jgi:hypothetical protein